MNHNPEYEAKTIKLLEENIGKWGMQRFFGTDANVLTIQ